MVYYVGGVVNTHVGDVINGVVIDPNSNMNLDGTFNGQLIGGATTTILSNAVVNGTTCCSSTATTPEPRSLVMLGSGLLGLGWLLTSRRREA